MKYGTHFLGEWMDINHLSLHIITFQWNPEKKVQNLKGWGVIMPQISILVVPAIGTNKSKNHLKKINLVLAKVS